MKQDAVSAFELNSEAMSPRIAEFFTGQGNDAIEAYGSVRLLHNTLSNFIPSIVEHGLVVGPASATPEEADVAIARKLFEEKGYYYPGNESQFNRYIAGTVDERKPGIFFYPKAGDDCSYNKGYGIPERMMIICREMGYVMIEKSGLFNPEEKKQATAIHEKYKKIIAGDPDAHIAVVEASPFSAPIINERLARIADVVGGKTKKQIVEMLSEPYAPFEGIYVPEPVPADGLEVHDKKLTLYFNGDMSASDFSSSRFYYTPAGLIKIRP